jgi:hypothetical protein
MKTSRLIVLLAAFTFGCARGPGALYPPEIDPAAAAQLAVELHDDNGDGSLNEDEWKSSAALAAVANRFDANGDAQLVVDEIRDGLVEWQENAVGPRVVPFVVQLDNRPLAGATVRLVPADFLADELKPATAETGVGGSGHLTMAPEDMPKNAPKIRLVQPGLYSVEITHPSRKVPARYNTKTTLGIEITSSNPGPVGILWSLSSK